MPVVSDPCFCLPNCLVCGRGAVAPHDCAVYILLESMVFQYRMVYGESTEAKLEEILQSGKEYLPRAMHMTDQNSVNWQRMYYYVKSGFPQHYGISSQNLVTPDVVFNILNAKFSSLATSFATSLNAGVALMEDPGNLFVESYNLPPLLHVQDSPVSRSVLVRKCVQDFIEKVHDMRRMPSKTSLVARVPVESLPAERPSERPAEPLMNILVNEVEVTSCIPTTPPPDHTL
ncbi:uncharacterized protein TNCV_3121131 [Trichonephila clavipes]|nr:uncharacterized protein TNCV_3121131 [Trichonephila clavipes]